MSSLKDRYNYTAPASLTEGQEVFVPSGRGRTIRCVVRSVDQNRALVENTQHDFKEWYLFRFLRVRSRGAA